MKTVILANGEFPKSRVCLDILNSADRIISCDGATQNILNYGLEPDIIIGDLDSVSKEIKEKYKHKIIEITEQNTNDLTKAVNWCVKNNILEFDILGATGKREDHSIANIALLSEYVKSVKTRIVSDNGVFIPIKQNTEFSSFKGQQISIFSMDINTKISSVGLKYPLKNTQLKKWWNGTLNESTQNNFILEFEKGVLIVFLLSV